MSRRPKKAGKKQRARKTVASPNVAVGSGGQRSATVAASLFDFACQAWTCSDYELAASGFREALKCDADDRHFARYWLASWLLALPPAQELDELLRERDDQSGVWRFAQALDLFRRNGDTDDARQTLVAADRLEPGFKRYLLQSELVDARRPVRFDGGADERAFGCARLFLPAWRSTPGAASWARRVLNVSARGADAAPRRFARDELRSLPARRETWQVGLRQFADRPRKGEGKMWMFGVVNVRGEEVRLLTVIDREPTEALLWNELVNAFLSPLDGKRAKPTELVVSRRDLPAAWKPWLDQIGIRCRYEDDPQPVGVMLEAMRETITREEQPLEHDVDVRELPQSDAVWQADFYRSPTWIEGENQAPYRPWAALVLEKSQSNALLTEIIPGDPIPEMMFDFLVKTMAGTRGQPAQRPKLIELSDSDTYDHLLPRLEAVGVACRLVDEMSELNHFCLYLAQGFEGSAKCALADGKGVTRAQMESFYEAADYYFKQAPWRMVPGEIPLEIRCDDPAMGVRYAVVLGRTGVQLGLCVYDDWEITQANLHGFATADDIRALAVCYDEEQIMAAVDLQLIERLGWPIATPEAWPAAMRLSPRRNPRSPTALELVFLDACLRAIPGFLKSATRSQALTVQTGTRDLELRLAVVG